MNPRDDDGLIAALSRAARDVAASEDGGPSPEAWHRLARVRTVARKSAPRHLVWVVAGAAAFASLLGTLKIVEHIRSTPLTYAVHGGVLRAGGEVNALSNDETAVHFSDGTEIDLDANARLAVTASGPHGARLRLRSGEAHFQVVHLPRAAWAVEVGPYLVEVTGTEFDVRWSETEQVAEVKMRSGSVRVSGPLLSERVALGKGQHLLARLGAGDVRIDDGRLATGVPPLPPPPWKLGAPSGKPAAEVGAPPQVASLETDGRSAREADGRPAHDGALSPRRPRAKARLALATPVVPSAPSSAAVPVTVPSIAPSVAPPPLDPAASWKADATAGARARAAAIEPEPTDAAGEPPLRPRDGGPARWIERRWASQVAVGDSRTVVTDAERVGLEVTLREADGADLAALADAARYSGMSELASRALTTERRRFPGTARARAAAFLLGRMADDRGDARAGLAWYRSYLGESPGGPYAAEALGREMLTVERLQGRDEALPLAREYLGRFPNGTYLLQARALVDNR
ncbi:MAG TPA: FecR domain-containing protein [Polyangia bacterium]